MPKKLRAVTKKALIHACNLLTMPKLTNNLFKRVECGTVSKALEISKNITSISTITLMQFLMNYMIGI